jgi:hypothetical protein
MDVASFLLNCISTLPNAEEISSLLLGGGDGEEEDDDGEAEASEDARISGENSKDFIPNASASLDTVLKIRNADTPETVLLQSTVNTPSPLPTLVNDDNDSVVVSCINPRGKFILYLCNHECILTNPKIPQEQIRFSAANVEHVIWFRKPEDYKTLKQLSENGKIKAKGVPGHMVLVCLTDGISFRNKAVKQVCFQLPSYPHPSTTSAAADITRSGGENNKETLTEKHWWKKISTTLVFEGAKGGIIRVPAMMDKPEFHTGKNKFVFCSEGESGRSTTTESLPYVGCYHGFNDGSLFPLREGLLFFKPPMFIPRSKLTSISCGRGSGGSRFVDMIAQLDADPGSKDQEDKTTKTLEFTNIHRDELNGLNNYIHQVLIPAMQSDADQADEGVAKAIDPTADNGNESDTDGSDDNDRENEAIAEVVHSSDDGGDNNKSDNETELEEESTRRRPPSRAAAKSAREITRAVLQSTAQGDDGESDYESVHFQETDNTSHGSDDTDGSENETDVSDDDSSVEGSDLDEDDRSASDDGKTIKKARFI